ncbi:MAG TPA: radical SAM protein [Acidobacteriota bacterium]|nr:radical SAM protein [Acidobacteriota bacterium]
MIVNEIFYSIQGESSFMGRPCAFIRLTGCNLRCAWCDSRYSFDEGTEMAVADIVRTVGRYPAALALVTGGEPMLQPAVHELLAALLEREYTVLLETGGHMPLEKVDRRVRKIVDFKCPSSGMEGHNDYDNVLCLTRDDEVKFVIGDRPDFDWACERVRSLGLVSRVGEILFSPVAGRISFADLADRVLQAGIPARLQLQLHKIIWPGRERGV